MRLDPAATAAAISLMLLGAAYTFQYGWGLAPCALCLTQRWAHFGVLLAYGLYRLIPHVATGLLGVAASGATVIAAFYHAGVEKSYWEGPSSCSGSGTPLSGLSGAELLSPEGPASIVRCTEISWQLLGISMAGWNGLISLAVLALWALALRRRQMGFKSQGATPDQA